MARDTPVGPPWITTSSGYLRDGSKSSGLCSTPSIAVPSWLFHDTISRVLVVHPDVCPFIAVSFFASRSAGPSTDATYTSPIDVASAPRNAAVRPSRVTVNADATHASPGVSRTMAFVSGSRRYRYDQVRCEALKKMPLGFQSTIDVSS